MLRKYFNRKGEMTTEQIVILVIAIASFAVIMYFLVSLGLGENTEDELCRNSVVQRGSLDKLPGISPDTIPLKCNKAYICLTKDGSCEKMYKPESIKVKTKSEVYEVLAEELANCWWMFGEGKIAYAGKDKLKNLYCSLCSQIAFDDSIKEIFPDGKINENELYEELVKMNKTNDETYFEYLFGSSNSEEFLKQDFGSINLDSQYYSLMAITGDISTLGWILTIGGATAVVVGAVALVPFTGGGSLGLLGSLTIATKAGVAAGVVVGGGASLAADTFSGKTVATTIKGRSGKDFIPPTLIKVNSEELEAIDCDYITTSS